MKNTIIAVAALAATAAAASVGSAVVVNACDYDVYLFNVPASDGGYSEIDETLSPGGSYTQEWTELTNGDGWSIKLSKSTSLSAIMQYEYTFLDDGTIWFDLSDVNGNPWDGDWEISSSDTSICSPKDVAYRYSTDDAYGEQSCPQAATLTVTLCSGDDTSSSSSSSSAAATSTTTTAAATSSATTLSTVTTTTTSEAAATTTTTSAAAATTTSNKPHGGHNHFGRRDAHQHHARHPHGHQA